MVGTAAEPLEGALNEAEALTAAGFGAGGLTLTEAEGLRADEASDGAAALTGPGDLTEAEAGSGEGGGGVGEGGLLSTKIDASGGKHRRQRCSSTWWAGT